MLRPSVLRSSLLRSLHQRPIRYYSQRASNETKTPQTRFDRMNSRLPKFLQRFTTPLRNAPVTHITSFLLLHELTAIIPLFALAGTFHYAEWMPPYVSEGKYISDGIQKFGNYFRRKGWINADEDGRPKEWKGRWWGRGESASRIVVEFATAYAITKALLPIRLVLSVWATPWFARTTVIPCLNAFRRVIGRKSKKGPTAASAANLSPAAGTGAVQSGVVPPKR